MEFKWLAEYTDGNSLAQFERHDVPAGSWDFMQPIKVPKIARFVVPMKDAERQGFLPLEQNHDFESRAFEDGTSEIVILDKPTMIARYHEGAKVNTREQALGVVMENSIHRDLDRTRIKKFSLFPMTGDRPHLVLHVPAGGEIIYRKRKQKKQAMNTGEFVGERNFWIVGWQTTRTLTVVDDRNPNQHKNIRVNNQVVHIVWDEGHIESLPTFMEPGAEGSRAEGQAPELIKGERWLLSETVD